MPEPTTTVFFYGLFMDASLLEAKGLSPSEPILVRADGFGLRIGERATLVRSKDECAYGVAMSLSEEDLSFLYGDGSVADYVRQEIDVVDSNGSRMNVVVYNLPPELLSGRNIDYARSLATVAEKVGLPEDYIAVIERWADLG